MSERVGGPQSVGKRTRPALMRQLAEYLEDLGALLLAVFAMINLLGLLGLTHGVVVDRWTEMLRRWLGWGAYVIPAAAGAAVWAIGRRGLGLRVRISWPKVIAGEIALFGVLALLTFADGSSLAGAESGVAGGLVGWGLVRLLSDSLGPLLALVLTILSTLAAGWYALRGLFEPRIEPVEVPASFAGLPPVSRRADSAGDVPAVGRQPGKRPAPSKPLPAAYRKDFKVGSVSVDAAASIERDDRLPPLDVFERGEWVRVTAREINQAAGLIEKTLADFGLPARVIGYRSGPSVTQYAVEPGFVEHNGADGESRRQKVRVSQISALANDLALALSAPTLRIEAPVPGHAYVGVEVPNRQASLVRLRPLLESEAFQSVGSPLTLALGRDVAGAPQVADLAAMPHLLIAGTTGSGKSVLMTAITACLVSNNTPDDLKLVLIDPKMVELVRFNGLPHLLGKVETELERIVGVLRWCTGEMDRRYRLLEEAKVRDLAAYNQRLRRLRNAERLPRLVVMIDELADLMMMAPDQTEQTIVRLAQMARATGIHLVVATQRPSTDIVTGLIKANFPARISFAVASSVDSRVILDGTGAETLLGRGDMLYLAAEAGIPIRLQGAYVDDREILRLVQYWSQTHPPQEGETVAPWEELLHRQAAFDEQDDILEQAIELVKRRGEASASMLQRQLRIGYPRAARLMDELEDLGVVGRVQSGGRTREILIGEDDDPRRAVDEGEDEQEA
jgi:S-DNA-T family DNA segregation ATPase FtsK/SpoIIIE